MVAVLWKKIITNYLTDKRIKFDDIGVYSENDEAIYPEIALIRLPGD